MEPRVVHEVTHDELALLMRLFEAAREHDGHDPLGEHKWLDLLHRTGFTGIVVDDGSTPLAYAHLSRHTGDRWGLETVVHPAHRHGDVAERLCVEALRVVGEQGGGQVNLWAFCATDASDELPRRLGFLPGRHLLNVVAALPVKDSAELPPGITLRPFEAGRDDEAWLEVNNRAFADHPEQGEWDIDTLRRRMELPWFDPGDFLLAVDDAGIAGFNWTKLRREQGVGEIYVVGVDPSRQKSGLGKALVIAGLEHLASRGAHECCLYVDSSNETALRLYQRIGFETDHEDRAYVTDVAPTEA